MTDHIVGANIAWPEDLGVESTTTAFGINMFGFLNAAPFLVGAILATLLTDPLIDAGLGRRWAIALGGWFSLIPVICKLFQMAALKLNCMYAHENSFRHNVCE